MTLLYKHNVQTRHTRALTGAHAQSCGNPACIISRLHMDSSMLLWHLKLTAEEASMGPAELSTAEIGSGCLLPCEVQLLSPVQAVENA